MVASAASRFDLRGLTPTLYFVQCGCGLWSRSAIFTRLVPHDLTLCLDNYIGDTRYIRVLLLGARCSVWAAFLDFLGLSEASVEDGVAAFAGAIFMDLRPISL